MGEDNDQSQPNKSNKICWVKDIRITFERETTKKHNDYIK